MRHHSFLLAAATSLLLLSACQTNEVQLRKEAQRYLDATGDYDIEEACLHCTPQTATGLRRINDFFMPLLDSSYIEKNTPSVITITHLTLIDDTSADVAYHKKTPIQEFDGTLRMVRRDGRWMASVAFLSPESIPQIHTAPPPDSVPELHVVKVAAQ